MKIILREIRGDSLDSRIQQMSQVKGEGDGVFLSNTIKTLQQNL